MDEKPGAQDDRYSTETKRLAQVLAFLVKDKPASVRSLEMKMGVGDSVFAKVLKSKITLQARHILMICDALGIEWSEFFAKAYGLAGETKIVFSEDAKLAQKMEPILIDLLIKIGLLPESAKPKPTETEKPSAGETPLASEDQPSPPES